MKEYRVNGREMRAAAIQVSSTRDKAENPETAERPIREAAGDGAELVAPRELRSCHGRDEAYCSNAEPVPGPTT